MHGATKNVNACGEVVAFQGVVRIVAAVRVRTRIIADGIPARALDAGDDGASSRRFNGF